MDRPRVQRSDNLKSVGAVPAIERRSVIQHMADTVLRTIADSTGKRRVLILRRENGAFGFEVEHWSDEPMEQCWIRPGQYPFSLCGSEEIALREALGRVDWLSAAVESAG